MKPCLFVLAILTLAGLSGFAEVQEKAAKIGGTTVRYKVVLPKNYDAAKSYPGVFAFWGRRANHGQHPSRRATHVPAVRRSLKPRWRSAVCSS
jgi:hypothetical protein